jgi:hypothetical protein
MYVTDIIHIIYTYMYTGESDWFTVTRSIVIVHPYILIDLAKAPNFTTSNYLALFS